MLNFMLGLDVDFDFSAYEKLTHEERVEKYPFLWEKLDRYLKNQKILGMVPSGASKSGFVEKR